MARRVQNRTRQVYAFYLLPPHCIAAEVQLQTPLLLPVRSNVPATSANYHSSLFSSYLRKLLEPDDAQVFRNYSHSLGPEEVEFLEEVIDRHAIPDEDVEASIDVIAKQYNLQEGKFTFLEYERSSR